MEKVKLNIENEIAWITLNRPEKRNAIDYDVIELFNEKLDIVHRNHGAKVVVITGTGDEAFCSGGDLSVFHRIHTKLDAEDMLLKMAKVLHKLFFFPKPTVAYLNGTAVGGGCEIATACDLRIASKNIKLGFIQGKLGITTGWGGSTYLMERVNNQEAFHLLMTADPFDATTGIKNGFVQNICDKENFEVWLSTLTKQSLGVLMAYKQRLLARYDSERIFKRVLDEIEDCSTLWESPEHHEAVQRFMNK